MGPVPLLLIWLSVALEAGLDSSFNQEFPRPLVSSDTIGHIYAITPAQGRVWLGTAKGLYELEALGAGQQPKRVGNLSSVRAIVPSHEGLWVGAAEGVYALVAARGLLPTRRYDGPVYSLYSSGEDDLWIGTKEGLCHSAEDQQCARVGQNIGVVFDIASFKNHLVVASMTGLYGYGRQSSTELEPFLTGAHVTRLLSDDSRYWYSVYKNGFMYFSARGTYSWHIESLGDVFSFARVGNMLWLGTESGLYRWHDAPDGETVQKIEGYSKPVVALTSVGDRLLVGTADGLYVVNPDAVNTSTPIPVQSHPPPRLSEPLPAVVTEEMAKQLMQLYRDGHYGDAIRQAKWLLDQPTQSTRDIPFNHNVLGVMLAYRGYWDEALRLFRSVASRADIRPELKAAAFRNVAQVLHLKGDLESARALSREAIGLPDDPKDHFSEVADAFEQEGGRLYDLGHAMRARAAYQQALALKQLTHGQNSQLIAVSLSDLGQVSWWLGDTAQAIAYQQKANAIVGSNLPLLTYDYALGLTNLGYFLLDSAPDRAVQMFRLADQQLRLSTSTNYVTIAEIEASLSVNSFGWGSAQCRSGQKSEGAGILRSAKPTTLTGEANVLFQLLRACGLDSSPEAATLYARLAQIVAVSGMSEPLRQMAYGLIEYQLRSGDYESAAKHLVQLSAVTRRLIASADPLPKSGRLRFLQKYVATETGLWLHLVSKGGDIVAAYDRVSSWKGLLNVPHSGHASEGVHARTAQRELEVVRQRLSSLMLRKRRLPEAEFREMLAETVAERDRLEGELVPMSGGLADMTGAGVQRRLRADEAFLDLYRATIDGVPQYFAFVATRESISVIDLGPAAALDDDVYDWLRDASSEMRQFRWSPALRKLLAVIHQAIPARYRSVAVSADGALSLIPWSLGSTTRTYWQVNGPRELVGLRSQRALKPTTMLLVGDLDYDRRFDDQSDNGPADLYFKRLEYTARELEAVESLAKKARIAVEILPGSFATGETIVERVRKGVSMVHVASHAYVLEHDSLKPQPDTPTMVEGHVTPIDLESRSALASAGLALSGANRSGKKGRVWTAEEVAGAPMAGVSLVVLSACDTARGAETSLQGVLGFRSAISWAGARTVLLSLWKVDDEATRLLMLEFYRAFFVGRMSKAEALQAAQRRVRSLPRFAAPRYWAAWILVGDPDY